MNMLTNYSCPKCLGDVYQSAIDGYKGQCFECDEDFYEIELISEESLFPHGYVCKQCCGPSPVGVGYVVDGEKAALASKDLKACGCGYSVLAE